MKRIGLIIFSALLICCLASPDARAMQEQSQDCLSCHKPGSTGSKLAIDHQALAASVHGGQLDCLECHPGAEDPAHRLIKEPRPVNCLACHQEQAEGHGSKGDPVRCWQCHGKHAIFSAENQLSFLHASNLAATCGKCHQEQALMQGFGANLLSFRLRGHGKADLAAGHQLANCLACHQGKAAHGENQPINQAHCYLCHNSQGAGNWVMGSLHGSSSAMERRPLLAFGNALYLLIIIGALALFCWGWWRRLALWARGKSENRGGSPGRRLWGAVSRIAAQRKLLRRKTMGLGHWLLVCGVALPVAIVVLTQAVFTLPPLVAGILSALLDLAGLGLLLGVVLALRARRGRITPEETPNKHGLAVLLLLGLIAVSGFALEGTRLAMLGSSWSWQHPLGGIMASIMPASALGVKLLWRLHLCLVMALVALTPFSNLRHALIAPLNLYFRNLGKPLALKSEEVESGNRFGVENSFDLSWKGLLDADACVSCGRCSEACPAQITGKPLSPMTVMEKILGDAEARRWAGPAANGRPPLAGGLLKPEEIWACTTCGACQEACPLAIEQMPKIVGLRRSLVLNHGDLPPEAAAVLRNLEVYGDPGGLGQAGRGDWLAGMDRDALCDAGEADCLIWVGCAGAFQPRGQAVARALLQLARRSGRRVALLEQGEMCCGDPARRLGQEALFQDIARRNIALLNQMKIKEIVTLCPHCLNSLANEYQELGGSFKVSAGVTWALDLLQDGSLKVKRKIPSRVAYHDPCYLARGAGLDQTPRALLEALLGNAPLELAQHGGQGFCCGAGGGGMWLHESGERINQHRAKQCLTTGAELVATACPYCIVMLEDGLGAEAEKPPAVADLLELTERATR